MGEDHKKSIEILDSELMGMVEISTILDGFKEDKTTIYRILKWVISRYGLDNIEIYDGLKPRQSQGIIKNELPDYNDFADLYDATNPKTEAEKALVSGYWITVGENKPEFTGQEVNNQLKNLGFRIGNITDALSSLNSRKPTLVMQTSKSGKTRQARKKYKLTKAGHDLVIKMINGQI